MMRPSVRYPRPWLAEPMDADRPEGAWQVTCPSSVNDWARIGLTVKDTGARTSVATYLTRGDAEDIAAGVNKLEAERRMNAEPAHP